MEYEFVSECGYKCQLTRNRLGIFCGYVQLPEHHPYYDKDYFDIKNIDLKFELSYGENGKFGFDCWNCLSPDETMRLIKSGKVYNGEWDYDKVKEETENMAKQFKKLET
ncbi:hypothetical protein Catovirus_1_651 [Catovirus CTV1]|uniref:Uncharacterized protein n=1 Tax=Catovirus CTV1 TaxID=1977631 RepID=A0A1V0SA89_9VIRU|nr:hypothetical protein Catovirus_1_651 [Catovirus CTV1]